MSHALITYVWCGPVRCGMKHLLSILIATHAALLAQVPVGADQGTWDRRFFLPGVNGRVHAVVPHGSDLYAGGNFDTTDQVPAANIARWDGTKWAALGSGINGTVLALAISGTNLYAGGMFSMAGDVEARNVARWNGSEWSPLGTGIGGIRVSALAVDAAGTLYAGGEFTNADNVAVLNIARWDGSNWSGLGAGLGNDIYPAWVLTLAVRGTDLYAGGFFTDAGGVPANCIAHWDGNAWSALGSGVDDRDYLPQVASIAFVGEDVHIGGSFALSGNTTVNHVARWNGSSWSALGGGLSRYFGDIPVTTLAASGPHLLVGGRFEMADGVPASNLARWNGSFWTEVGGGADGSIHAIGVAGASAWVAGWFGLTNTARLHGVASWENPEWRNLSSGGGQGLSGPRTCTVQCLGDEVSVLVRDGPIIYAAGSFLVAGAIEASNVARWNGTGWEPLGSGLNGPVFSLVMMQNQLVAGGDFSLAGEVPVSNIASWNGSAWTPLQAGVNGTVRALTQLEDRLYAGGDFTAAGGVAAAHIACWDGNGWTPLGNGINGSVCALAGGSGGLFAGGKFTQAGMVSSTNVACWNGAAWSPLQGGVHGAPNPSVRFRPPPVSALLGLENRLIVAGDFAFAGTIPATNVACWNGSAWSALGGGLSSVLGSSPPPAVAALASAEGTLYAGGSFNRIGFAPAQGLARWDGLGWEPLDEGIAVGLYSAPSVGALLHDGFDLYVGGHFKFAGSQPDAAFAIWHEPPRLRIGRTVAGNLSVSWPGWASDHELQARDNLTPGPWTTIQATVSVDGTQRTVTQAPNGSRRFYRLQQAP